MLRGTHPFIVFGVGFGALVTVANLVLIARGREVRRGLVVAVLVVTLALSTMLGKGTR